MLKDVPIYIETKRLKKYLKAFEHTFQQHVPKYHCEAHSSMVMKS